MIFICCFEIAVIQNRTALAGPLDPLPSSAPAGFAGFA
jgi:hypothetical protein